MKTSLFSPPFDISRDVLDRAARIKLALFDVDGVLTDGRVILGADDEYKCFDIKDGHGLRMLARHGVATGIITGRSSAAVTRRAQELGIEHVHQGCKEKLPFFHTLLAQLGLTPVQVAYMGDDWMDLPVMLQAGLAVAVHDAHALVRQHAHWVTPSGGGRGAARELAELLVYARGGYDGEVARYLSADTAAAPGA
jgi:3-deoxy-D-manno-octulosonate 8-phosphate phosphatase (KDO 8-P phosphatase)